MLLPLMSSSNSCCVQAGLISKPAHALMRKSTLLQWRLCQTNGGWVSSLEASPHLSPRRHGHNEMDEPRATLPLSCAAIDAHPRVLQLYTQDLERRGVASAAEVAAWQAVAAAAFDAEFTAFRSGGYNVSPVQWLNSTWQGDALQVSLWTKSSEKASGTRADETCSD